MINKLFLIKNEREYQASCEMIEKEKLNSPVILSWSEQKPYINNSYSHLKNVLKWEDFNVQDIGLNRYWLKNYKEIERIARKTVGELYQDQTVKSPHFIFGLVWNLGNYCHYLDSLNTFFKGYRPAVIYFNPEKGFISDLILYLINLYKVKHNNLIL